MEESKYIPIRPAFLGVHIFEDVPLDELRNYIDWTPFFLSWELRGKYPAIFDDAQCGDAAQKLFEDANQILNKIINEKLLTSKAVCGFFSANSVNHDDIEIYTDDKRNEVLITLNMLRQQIKRGQNLPNLCLSDFIAPKETGISDYIGAFVVTAGIGTIELCKKYEELHDDYSAILVKALADRLAEAAAEWLHEQVRRKLWGFASNEILTNEERIAEQYQGIRPAPGYPACPDHTEKKKLFDLLDATNHTNVILTEGYAMTPAASVSGWYFAHPSSHYFGVGKITREQLDDYAQRKSWTNEEAEHWLAANLEYNS